MSTEYQLLAENKNAQSMNHTPPPEKRQSPRLKLISFSPGLCLTHYIQEAFGPIPGISCSWVTGRWRQLIYAKTTTTTTTSSGTHAHRYFTGFIQALKATCTKGYCTDLLPLKITYATQGIKVIFSGISLLSTSDWPHLF